MSIGDPKADRELAKLFDPTYAHNFYKNPEAHLAQAKALIERNSKCQNCGKKELEVKSMEEQEAVCKACGHTQT